MYYKQRRRLYSQNFLRNPKLVAKLIRHSSIGKKDTVLEIGPGKGIITSALLDIAGKVIAVERDTNLYWSLKARFSGNERLVLVNQDFLKFRLPNYPYKVFSNIPFIITADVIKKLTSDKNLIEAYLVVQKEAARKFIGRPYADKNSMMTTLLKAWFELSIFWKLKRSDFVPIPNVDVVMIKIKRLEKPLISVEQKEIFRDFVLYTYNRSKVAKINTVQLIKLFEDYIRRASERQKKSVALEARRILTGQENLQKIHRTRTDKNWRRF